MFVFLLDFLLLLFFFLFLLYSLMLHFLLLSALLYLLFFLHLLLLLFFFSLSRVSKRLYNFSGNHVFSIFPYYQLFMFTIFAKLCFNVCF